MEIPEKQVFGPYWDGDKLRYGDPMEIRRKLKGKLAPHEKEILEDYRSPLPELSEPAAERLHAAIIHAFELLPFDKLSSAGCTEEIVVGIWNDFQSWLKKKGESTEPTRTLSECLESKLGNVSTDQSPTAPIVESLSISPASG